MGMKKNLDNKESEQHWEFVERTSTDFSEWPSWKKAQYSEVIGEPISTQKQAEEARGKIRDCDS